MARRSAGALRAPAAAMVLAAVILVGAMAAAAEKLSPLGVWLAVSDAGTKAHIRIHECGDKLCGKLIWSEAPDARDIHNPDESLRGRSLLGIDIMTGLTPDGENSWDYGRIYDGSTGKTWNCSITVLPGNRQLKIRGYWGLSLFGQSRVWERVE